MGRTVDLMEEAFEKIANDGEMMLDKEFMMNIFEQLWIKLTICRISGIHI
jgi:hypothetical protein